MWMTIHGHVAPELENFPGCELTQEYYRAGKPFTDVKVIDGSEAEKEAAEMGGTPQYQS